MSEIFVAGHGGLVGSAICRQLESRGVSALTASRTQLDLTDQAAVDEYFRTEEIAEVYLAAAKVGGIHANASKPAEFIHENLSIQTNVIHSAWKHGVSKLLFLGSSCIYPRLATQPITEDQLLSGPLETTNEWYAIAKIAGIKMCQAYRKQYGFDAIAVMPTNLYGPHDDFDLQSSHVLPALIRKFDDARTTGAETVSVWGSGLPRREFLFVDDLASACIFLMENYSDEKIINVGWQKEIGIAELASLVGEVVGFKGAIEFDSSMPDGAPRKLLDCSRLTSLGWKPSVGLREGMVRTYDWYRQARRDAEE